MLRIRLLQGFSWFSFYQKQDINYTGKHQKKSLTNNISARPIFHAYIIIIMYARKGTGLLHTHCSRPCSPFLSSTSRHPDYTIIVFALFLAKVGRLVAMPSTSRTLPISEDTKQNQNFTEIPWRRPLFSLSQKTASKKAYG